MRSEKFFLFWYSVLTLTTYLDNRGKSKHSDSSLFVKSFVKQGLKELIKIIPSKFKIDKLLIYIDVENVKSKFIPISLGFKKESEISQFEFYNGSYHDFEIYGLNVNEGNIAND